MSDKTGIEWTDATWNPLRGCSKVSSGCAHCYAEKVAARFSGPGLAYAGTITDGKWNGTIRLVEEHVADPLRWQRPRKIFVNSMSDLFHENVPEAFITRIFAVMALATQHTFQVLTKRPQRMLDWSRRNSDRLHDEIQKVTKAKSSNYYWPLSNVWLGVSVEDQATADARIPILLQQLAAVRWLSVEPLLGPIDIFGNCIPGCAVCADREVAKNIHWVVVGGESGPGARPMLPEWVHSIRNQCVAASVKFFFKQWGEGHGPKHSVFQRLVNGREWNEFPAALVEA